ncbi:hypothetical protein ACFY0R_03030 [Streptomyces sp. NPDC001633]|uniref:hypothetical protein n=1 Tax=Streptomyces sp. NPDC001633 TaxID=3364595 RepID=UPI00369BE2AD
MLWAAWGIAPRLSDVERVTGHDAGHARFSSEVRWWLRHARTHLEDLSPYLPQQPGYDKRLREAAQLIRRDLPDLPLSAGAGPAVCALS